MDSSSYFGNFDDAQADAILRAAQAGPFPLPALYREEALMARAQDVAAVLTGLVLTVTASARSGSVDDVLSTLHAGGHVIVLRHGATHNDQADTDPLNLDNVAKQRQLNDKGRADARALGEVFRRAGVPLGRVYSSRFQRAVETARLIVGREPEATADVSEGGLVVSPNENNRRAQALRALVAAVPDAGTNTLIVTHRPNIMDALGRDWFDIREGEAAVFRPDGAGGHAVAGRVQIGQWATAK
jgi:broad specificity phosphatase PhoE